MHDQVERVVKGTECEDDADRFLLCKRKSADIFIGLRYGHDLACFMTQRFITKLYAINGTCNFDT